MKRNIFLPVIICFFAGITNGQSISSLQVIPANPTSTDNIQAVVNLSFPNSPCHYVTSQITSSHDTIIINSYYCHETGSGTCTSTDTFDIGQLSAGNYVVRFLLSSRPNGSNCGQYQLYAADFKAFSVSGTTGIEVSKIIVASNYPNPSSGTLFMNFYNSNQSEVEIKLYDLNGSTVRKWNIAGQAGLNQYSLDVNDLPASVYLYQLKTSSGNAFGKIAISR